MNLNFGGAGGNSMSLQTLPPGRRRQPEPAGPPDLSEFLGADDLNTDASGTWDGSGLTRNLHAHVARAWQQAKIAKEPHERELLRCLRQREGIYETSVLDVIRAGGGSEIYMQLTQVKCRALEGWVRDILFQAGQRPYEIRPTPVPDIPEEIRAQLKARIEAEVQELMAAGLIPSQEAIERRLQDVEARLKDLAKEFAAERAERMNDRINDELDEGGWKEEFEQFITDFVTYPAAFFCGPVRTRKAVMGWATDAYGRTFPRVSEEVRRRYERISPWDVFPSPNARSIDDGPIIIRRRYRPEHLYDLIGLPTYDERAIRDALEQYSESGHELLTSHEDERNRLEGRDHEDWSTDKPIEAIDFWGKVRGRTLLDWGFPPTQIPDPADHYECNVIVVGNYVIRAALNPHPLGRRPISSQSLEKVPGQIWGRGLPQLIRDVQDQANTCARALANNVTLASGFVGDINVDRLAAGEDPYDIGPFRMFQTKSPSFATSQRAVSFFQPSMNAEPLIASYRFFSELCDEYAGIPAYATGVNTRGGAASTATGLTMLLEQAARGVKYAVWALDAVIIYVVRATWEDLMLFDPDESIKGDANIVARASTALMHRDRDASRQAELMQATSNPIDQQILGLLGRRKQLEELFRSRDIDPEGIVPSEDDLKVTIMQQQQAAMQQAQAEAQAGGLGGAPAKAKEQTPDGRRAGGPQPAER